MSLLRGLPRICRTSFYLHFNEDKVCGGSISQTHIRTLITFANPILTNIIEFKNLKKISLVNLVRPLSLTGYMGEKKVESSSSSSLADELLTSKLDESGGKTAEDSAKEADESKRTVKALKFSFLALGMMLGGIGGFLIFTYGGPLQDRDGKILRDEYSNLPIIKQYFYRTMNEVKYMNKMIQEPIRDELLPDPLKEPYIQPPYTLILELKDVLVHPEWTYGTGWRFKKRPGVDFLLQHCAPPLFEIVIYTNENGFTAYPVIEQLDKQGFIWYKLFKDSTRYVDGKHLKDLYCINRDLNKVIMVDWDREAVTAHRNQLCIPRWKGEMKDQSLMELALMLRTIAETQVSDVREVLDYYSKYDDPIAAFAENHRQAQEQENEAMKIREEEIKNRGFTPSVFNSFLRRK